MGSWHRENPELCGTDADPWMQHAGHRAAYRELRDAGLIYSDEIEDEDVAAPVSAAERDDVLKHLGDAASSGEL